MILTFLADVYLVRRSSVRGTWHSDLVRVLERTPDSRRRDEGATNQGRVGANSVAGIQARQHNEGPFYSLSDQGPHRCTYARVYATVRSQTRLRRSEPDLDAVT